MFSSDCIVRLPTSVRGFIVAGVLALACFMPASAENPPPAAGGPQTSSADAPGTAPRSREQLVRDLQDMLTNVELNGTFRMTSDLKQRVPLGPPSDEKYTIVSAAPDADDFWIFTARIQYGEHDVQLPLRLKVLWAGDTPVVTVDQVTFPGLGTYSARVIFYQGYYSGTWFGANCGGVLAGEIRKPAPAAPAAPAQSPPASSSAPARQ